MCIQWPIPEVKTEDTVVFQYSLFSSEDKLILAPLQNLTSLFFRKTYCKYFVKNFDYAVSPFISVTSNIEHASKILYKDVDPQLNKNIMPLTPQLLGNNPSQILSCCRVLECMGYRNVNLNMGCPKHDIVFNIRGAGLLKNKDLARNIIDTITNKTHLQLSLKVRLGIHSPNEIEGFIDIFNSFNLKEIIIHPRTVEQQYGGDTNLNELEFLSKNLKADIVYNGDIFTVEDFKYLKQIFPKIKRWMIGRGVVRNPFLPSEIRGINYNKNQILKPYIKDLAKEFNASLIRQNDLSVLNKMKEISKYLCQGFGVDVGPFVHSKNLNEILSLFEHNF